MLNQPNSLLRNGKVICYVVLLGTYALVAIIALLLWVSFSVLHNEQVLGRLILCGLAGFYIVIAHMLLRHTLYRVVAYLLILFYTALAFGILWSWGINTPIGLLMLGLVIVFAGILLTSRHALMAAGLAASTLVVNQLVMVLDWHQPNTAWTSSSSHFGDVIAYSVIYLILALMSWLYNREMEQSLRQAKQAEAQLLVQKDTLKLQVEKRTAQLKRVQLQEMQQMYRFTQLGQLGVSMLHDLANHLTALTLEIEGLHKKRQSDDVARARMIMRYLEAIVDNTRERMHGNDQKQSFDIAQRTGNVVNFLQYKALKANVTVDWRPPANSWRYNGDPTCFSQVVAILVGNAIDAYEDMPTNDKTLAKRRVEIVLRRNSSHIIVRIEDWGPGISKSERAELFKPFRSTKKSGLGLGLFIAKQTVEINFGGKLMLDPISDHTVFIIKLPRNNAS